MDQHRTDHTVGCRDGRTLLNCPWGLYRGTEIDSGGIDIAGIVIASAKQQASLKYVWAGL